MNKRLIIIGSGGYGRVVADIANQLNIYKSILFLDDNDTTGDVIGQCDDYKKFIDENTDTIPAFGNNELRLSIIDRLEADGANVPTLIHKTAYVSQTARIEKGTVVLPNAVVNSYTVVEKGCIINIGAIVDHNCVIGKGAHICLGAIVKADNHIPSCMKIDAGVVVENKTYKSEEN